MIAKGFRSIESVECVEVGEEMHDCGYCGPRAVMDGELFSFLARASTSSPTTSPAE